jgi:hypothetical protein
MLTPLFGLEDAVFYQPRNAGRITSSLPSPPWYVFSLPSDRLTRSRQAQAGSGVDNSFACACRLRVKRLYDNEIGISRCVKVALSN